MPIFYDRQDDTFSPNAPWRGFALGCGLPASGIGGGVSGLLGRWQATRLRFEARLAEMAQDAETLAARDAALVAQYPHLAAMRAAVAVRGVLAKNDDGALTAAEVEHLRFIAWLIEQGRIGEGDTSAEPSAADDEPTGETTPAPDEAAE